jgi:acyl carrier protein
MNSNLIKYNGIFCDVFCVTDSSQLPLLQLKVSQQWDSVGHIGLISALEEAFDIDIEPEDMFEITSYLIGIEVLKDKYNIDF